MKIKDLPLDGLTKIYSRGQKRVLGSFFDEDYPEEYANLKIISMYAYESVIYLDVE